MKRKILVSLILTLLTTPPTLQASGSYFSGSLDCSFKKNGIKELKLRVKKGNDYEEENAEIYTGKDGEVEAHVIYLPYQYGILLSLKSEESLSEAQGLSFASTSISVNTDDYTLSCTEEE